MRYGLYKAHYWTWTNSWEEFEKQVWGGGGLTGGCACVRTVHMQQLVQDDYTIQIRNYKNKSQSHPRLYIYLITPHLHCITCTYTEAHFLVCCEYGHGLILSMQVAESVTT